MHGIETTPTEMDFLIMETRYLSLHSHTQNCPPNRGNSKFPFRLLQALGLLQIERQAQVGRNRVAGRGVCQQRVGLAQATDRAVKVLVIMPRVASLSSSEARNSSLVGSLTTICAVSVTPPALPIVTGPFSPDATSPSV